MKNPRIHPTTTGLAWLAAAALALAPAAAEQDRGATNDRRVVHEGIGIELELEPIEAQAAARELREGDTVNFRFRITDTNTETPLSGVYPAAWMDRRADGDEDASCRDKVEAFIGGSLFAPPELDLNVYYVLALNHDATISVVDPLFGFGTTKLLDMIFLESPGGDWALSEDQMTLYVSLPEVNKLAVASTATWDVEHNLGVGPDPSRVVLQGDGRYLWVGFDGPTDGISGVTVVDTTEAAVVKTLLTGNGHHEIALSSDDRWAFVTNVGDGTLSVIDVATLEIAETLPVGREPVSVAYSPIAKAAYVTSRSDGTVVAVDPERREVVARIEAEPGVGQIRFAPGGQLGFVANPETDEVYILDAALSRIVQTAEVEDGPDQVSFSDHLAYIRHQGSEIVLMIPIEQVGREGATVPLIEFTGGQRPFGQGILPSPANSIVQAPGATAVLVANPADKTIYFYKEGMAAPMGNFQNYNRQPRAVLPVDRSLEERAPGSYETLATLRRPGTYDLAFFLDSPRTVHCFEVEVAPSPEAQAARAKSQPVKVQPTLDGRVLTHGERVTRPVGSTLAFSLELVDPATGEARTDLGDLRVLTFRGPGRDQQRRWARKTDSGTYRFDFVPPRAGVYYLFVESASAGLRYNQSTQVIVVVEDAPDDSPAGTSAKSSSLAT